MNVNVFSAGGSMGHRSIMQREFERELPGEGFVAIDVRAVHSLLRGRSFVGELRVERRAPARRAGHSPPTIGTASGATVEDVVRQLLPVAQSNVSIGAALQARSLASRPLRQTAPHR
jgi:hypothetical protein